MLAKWSLSAVISAARPPCAATACQSQPAKRRADELHGHQRVVDGERGGVLHEDARLAGAAGARPDEVAVEEALADVRARRR